MFINNDLVYGGFGDRILDCISFFTVCNLLNKKGIYLWNKDGKNPILWKSPNSNKMTYDINLFFFDKDDNKILYEIKNKYENFEIFSFREIIDIEEKNLKRKKYSGGTATPYRVLNSSKIKEQILPNISSENYILKYKQTANILKPCKLLESCINKNLNKCIGIHIRRTDKIKNTRKIWEILPEEQKNLDIKLENYIKNILEKKEENFFVCGDDINYVKYLSNYIISNGGNIYGYDNNFEKYTKIEGFNALLDFFSLSNCKCIIQNTKYTTFSMAASMINNTEIINLYGKENNLIQIWEDLLNLRFL